MEDKRIKRILANRQSAARSKERKTRYVKELEMRVQRLRTEATNISAQLAMHERSTTYLAALNMELKMKIEDKKQKLQLRTELNEAMKEEILRLRERIIHSAAISGNPYFAVLVNQLTSNYDMQELTNPPPQQPQLCMPPPPPPDPDQPFNWQCCPNFMDFNQKK